MNTRVRYKSFDQISFADITVYSQLPVHSFWSRVADKIDFSFADALCAVLYTGRGQLPYAPSLKLKVHLVQAYYDLSDRKVEEKVIGDLFVKRFLGLSVDFFGFDHSTIGLDRSRMGTTMFHACHLYILAQMYALGLWGHKDEQWIIDSFPSRPGIVMVGARRLIQKSMIRILQHMKRTHPALYKLANESLLLDALTARVTSNSSVSDQLLAFSNLVAQAHALLYWFETEAFVQLVSVWDNDKAKQKLFELEAVLKQVLLENSRPCDPGDGDTPPESNPETESEDHEAVEHLPDQPEVKLVAEEAPVLQYEKVPRKERPSHRIISAHDPEARIGAKSRFVMIKGYKTQNLVSSSSIILDTRAVPASEPDHLAMLDMVRGIKDFFQITPTALLGDTAYGFGRQRLEMLALGINVVAPVPTNNPTSLYGISKFTYDHEKDVYTCPNGKETIRKHYYPSLEGWQFIFGKKNCNECPFRNECTTSKKSGRTVFQSDYFNIYEAAKKINESETGKELYKQRYLVERKNNELKTDCGLGKPRTRGQEALQIKATLAGIVINLKLLVRRLFAPSPGFIRRAKRT